MKHRCKLGSIGKMRAWKHTHLFSGVKVGEGESYKAKAETHSCITCEEWKLFLGVGQEVVKKEAWCSLSTGSELEFISNAVAYRK